MKPLDERQAARLALGNILREGTDDVFSPPFEIDLLRRNTRLQRELAAGVARSLRAKSLDQLEIGFPQFILLPKTKPFDFRRCALFEPIDAMKYLALVLLAAPVIEAARVPAGERRIFSYRFQPRGRLLFNPRFNYKSFRQRAAALAGTRGTKFLVKCDIASFYTRLNLHRLESTLASLKLDPWLVKALNELLLFWAQRDSFGLPIGGNASRILAEASLIEVDSFLLRRGVNFVRFVDDFQMFATSVEQAHDWLMQLIERLQLEGLSINQPKTTIEPIGPQHRRRYTATPTTARIIAGYGGTVPTMYRRPAGRELVRLRGITLQGLAGQVAAGTLLAADVIKDLIKVIATTKKFDQLPVVLAAVKLFPQFVPYACDMMRKHAADISTHQAQTVTGALRDWLKQAGGLPEYLAVEFVRLLARPPFEDKAFLLELLRDQRRSAGGYVGRTLIDALAPLVNRGEVIEVRSYYDRANSWERRAIIRMVKSCLPDGEKRPWLKNMRMREKGDLLALEIDEPFGRKVSKRGNRPRRNPGKPSATTPPATPPKTK